MKQLRLVARQYRFVVVQGRGRVDCLPELFPGHGDSENFYRIVRKDVGFRVSGIHRGAEQALIMLYSVEDVVLCVSLLVDHPVMGRPKGLKRMDLFRGGPWEVPDSVPGSIDGRYYSCGSLKNGASCLLRDGGDFVVVYVDAGGVGHEWQRRREYRFALQLMVNCAWSLEVIDERARDLGVARDRGFGRLVAWFVTK
ncbi:hypothetical protein OZX67_07120 [Bifidobacterium sp. ESL0728]|uniref:hypothetical protein n=1 Tax=Bifidobacterium sp. ESL0728 TaxID=2983220 RepID=UPI0023F8A16F|nr:hypothetical protein [Bifidobacterium sp. ESL0728]WEV58568.1 hypothetical protein OZX67_07120 [Bifidobacterium sp. ESL0728]